MNKLKELFNKYKEIILYVFFGGLTTLLSVILIYVFDCNGIIGVKARIIADIICIIFAYITNKIWVFESKCKNFKELIKEVISFFGARGLTTLLSVIITFIFVDCLHFNNLIVQYSTSVIVTILNYVFSKLVVFKKK